MTLKPHNLALVQISSFAMQLKCTICKSLVKMQ